MKGVLRTLRTGVGRVYRDIERQIDKVPEQQQTKLQDLLSRTQRILTQKPHDKNKLYALHAPEVECIAKGNARTPYEFGVKVSIVTTHKEGLVVGARSMPGKKRKDLRREEGGESNDRRRPCSEKSARSNS